MLFEKADIIQYVDNITTGDSVVLFNLGNAGYDQWPLEAKQKLGELGISVTQINSLQPGEPVIIFARKGATAGTARVFHDNTSAPTEQKAKFTGTVTGRISSGVMQSTVVGPSLG